MAKAKAQEFDKDYIFNLIMPSGSPAGSDTSDDSADFPPVQESVADDLSDDLSYQDSLSELKSKLFVHKDGLKINESKTGNLVLVNLMESLVVDRLDAAFEKFNCCKCDKCKKDVAVHALNSLTPQYVLAEPDSIGELAHTCSTKEVSGAIIKAILQVKNHPQH